MRSQTGGAHTVPARIGRLIRLDLGVFDEISSDTSATRSAVIVVTIASFLSGLGTMLWWLVRNFNFGDDVDVLLRSLILGSLFQVGVWIIWVYVVHLILARYGVVVDFYRLLRTMGFAFVPMGVAVLMVIAPLGIPIALFGLAATVLLTNVAIQSASRADTRQVIVANLGGLTAFVVIMGILANIAQVEGPLGGFAPGIFFFNLA